MRVWLVLAMVLSLSGIAFAEETRIKEKTPEVSENTKNLVLVERTGTIKVTGRARFSFVEIHSETGKDILTGELADELKRIAGHKVRVKATAGEKIRGFDALQVVSYHILKADDGQKPTVGKVEVIRKQPFLLVPDLGQPLALSGNRHMLEKLMEQDGAKVWIVGRMQKERLKVVKYGVLRPVDPEKCKKKRFVPPLKPMMRLDPIKKK